MNQTETENVLSIYSSISGKTGEMVEAARASDWDKLVALEKECSALIERLKGTDASPKTSANFVERKITYIRKALADDAEVRRYTEPWMNQLEAYIGSARRTRKVLRAYEPE